VELHDKHITCFRFSETVETRFWFIETDQCHYQRLLEEKQRKYEDAISLSDRVKLLAQKTLPSSGDPAVQTVVTEKRQTSAFTHVHGLRPNISTAVQLQAARTMERAIEIANTLYFTFKSKNDMDDVHINFTGRRYHDWHSMSCGHRSQVSRLVLCTVVTEDTFTLRTTGLWYHVLDLLGKHIPIRVNIKRVQMQLNIQLLHVAVEGCNYTTTVIVQLIANMYHDRTS